MFLITADLMVASERLVLDGRYPLAFLIAASPTKHFYLTFSTCCTQDRFWSTTVPRYFSDSCLLMNSPFRQKND